eukprot:1764533-Prorocentrum_lima.AAC.1
MEVNSLEGQHHHASPAHELITENVRIQTRSQEIPEGLSRPICKIISEFKEPDSKFGRSVKFCKRKNDTPAKAD